MEQVKIRPPMHTGGSPIKIPEDLESRTVTSLGNDTDVNNIMERFSRTGQMPPSTRQGVYADVSNVTDLSDTMIAGQNAREEIEAAQQEAPVNESVEDAPVSPEIPAATEETPDATE